MTPRYTRRPMARDALSWQTSAADVGLLIDPGRRENALKDQDLDILRDNPEFRRLVGSPRQGL
jgi:hypothetical protein